MLMRHDVEPVPLSDASPGSKVAVVVAVGSLTRLFSASDSEVPTMFARFPSVRLLRSRTGSDHARQEPNASWGSRRTSREGATTRGCPIEIGALAAAERSTFDAEPELGTVPAPPLTRVLLAFNTVVNYGRAYFCRRTPSCQPALSFRCEGIVDVGIQWKRCSNHEPSIHSRIELSFPSLVISHSSCTSLEKKAKKRRKPKIKPSAVGIDCFFKVLPLEKYPGSGK